MRHVDRRHRVVGKHFDFGTIGSAFERAPREQRR
jgi:hypothetical protein